MPTARSQSGASSPPAACTTAKAISWLPSSAPITDASAHRPPARKPLPSWSRNGGRRTGGRGPSGHTGLVPAPRGFQPLSGRSGQDYEQQHEQRDHGCQHTQPHPQSPLPMPRRPRPYPPRQRPHARARLARPQLGFAFEGGRRRVRPRDRGRARLLGALERRRELRVGRPARGPLELLGPLKSGGELRVGRPARGTLVRGSGLGGGAGALGQLEGGGELVGTFERGGRVASAAARARSASSRAAASSSPRLSAAAVSASVAARARSASSRAAASSSARAIAAASSPSRRTSSLARSTALA